MNGREVYDGTGIGYYWRAHVVPAGKKWRFIIERKFGRFGWDREVKSRRYRDRAKCEDAANRWLDKKEPLSPETVIAREDVHREERT